MWWSFNDLNSGCQEETNQGTLEKHIPSSLPQKSDLEELKDVG